jgi:hypothetical protein
VLSCAEFRRRSSQRAGTLTSCPVWEGKAGGQLEPRPPGIGNRRPGLATTRTGILARVMSN